MNHRVGFILLACFGLMTIFCFQRYLAVRSSTTEAIHASEKCKAIKRAFDQLASGNRSAILKACEKAKITQRQFSYNAPLFQANDPMQYHAETVSLSSVSLPQMLRFLQELPHHSSFQIVKLKMTHSNSVSDSLRWDVKMTLIPDLEGADWH